MATKNTRDNTYYSVSKVFTFSSVMLILLPIVNLILTLVQRNNGSPAIKTTIQVISIITLVFVIVWIILNIVMFVCAGNLRGIKSPMGIRLGLLVSMALGFAGTIVWTLAVYGVIKNISPTAGTILTIVLPIAQVLGFMIAAILGHNIKKALKQ